MKLDREEKIFQNSITVTILSLGTCFLWGSAFPAIKIGFVLFSIEDTGSKILFAGYRFFAAGIATLIVLSILIKK